MYRMVVIDDEYMVVKGIQAILARQQMDYEVVGSACDGISGLEVVREQKPDLVLTDIRMPGLDGLSLIESAREFCPDTTFVVISGYTEFEYARRAMTLGVRGYIDKPITVEKLAAVLQRVEQEWQEQKERSAHASMEVSTGIEETETAEFVPTSQGTGRRVIQDLLDYIGKHYSEDLGLSELADRADMSTAYISVLFKNEVGVSFIKYLTNLRVERAKELLRQGLKVKDVSEQVGYNNYRYFCDIFKRAVGQTPQSYKEEPGDS